MEKIYMEDNNKNSKKSTTNRFLKGKGVVTASVFITIVAIVAFVATSFNNPSWAVPSASSNLADQFTLELESDDTLYSSVTNGTTSQRVPRFWAFSTSGSTVTSTPVFCLEEDIDVNDGIAYRIDNDDKAADDYGILYILANGYYNGDSFIKGLLSSTERIVVTQIALWNYLYDSNSSTSLRFKEDFADKFNIKNGSIGSDFHLELNHTSDIKKSRVYDNLLYKNYIAKLVAGAKTASAADTMPNISVSKENDDVTLTEDKKYYQSSAIVTSSNNDTKLFTVKIGDSSPKGTVLVDENGVALEEGAEYSIGKKFYVRFPVDSVGESGVTINLTLKTSGGYKYTGKVYRAYNKDTNEFIAGQKIIGVDVEPHDVPAEISLEYVPGPNTGMNVSQVIYFVGLVILVCGVGIVYANIKPKESN